ncbi:dTDP-4-dehydrorhamnose reductase [Mucilaginibacter sp. RS28]|uniref:dTDP-4-dehydrorhamnose reductase n=1 Tax=Mucilaginibacter straminoryzae TaxID=2932774 RepID=A0A9X1X324_9SPHI|nr:dTDP-4-dehydrorhamnose reductase [Mucilaginibacter straminoryzae]MCJ8210219.1 dTDP-4-dehydrorhamnose reductase [Mucilaginibacter straminoryzae]
MGKILVFGGSGQLGHCLKTVADRVNFSEIEFPTEKDANILNEEGLKQLFEKYQPKYAINCAAYTAVDKAEDEVELARQVNRDGAANLAKLCRNYDCTLVHVSTDFVFDGNVPKLLAEEDIATPVNVYGLTKLEGEQAITAEWEKHYILRTSWLYSEFGNNFVKTMLKLGAERTELNVIADQVGTPTYAIDLAAAILNVIQHDEHQYGIYHYSNEGVTSWFDFAKGIFDIAEVNIKVNPIKSSEYITKAIRPAFSVMDKSKIKSTFKLEIPYWRDSLIACINALK